MLKVIEVEVGHNKRLRSGLIENILYKPESPYQIIVGPNGVGKSAVMEEITAYPSPSSVFEKDGISRVVFETDEGIVETKSIVGTSVRHEFWKGGENLNTGGTASVQKDLVALHLKMSDLGYDIATNKISFVNLTVAKRQEVLAQLANNDMAYAYNLWIRAKKKLSHATGARNMLAESLVEKQVSDVSDEEIKALESRLEDYNTQALSLLTELKEARAFSKLPTAQDWLSLKANGERIIRSSPRTPLDAVDRIEYSNKIIEVESSIRDIKSQQRVLQEQYDALDDVIKRSADSSEENLNTRRLEISHWSNQLTELCDKKLFAPNIYPDDTDFSQVKKELDAILHTWRDTLSQMEEDAEDSFTRENFTALKETREKYQLHLNSLNLKKSRYLEQLDHLAKGVKVNCPGCGLYFVPGREKDAEKKARSALNELSESIEKGEVAINEVNMKLSKVEQWIQLYRELLSLERVCPTATPFFTEVSQRAVIRNQPTHALTIASFLYQDIEILESIDYVRKKKKETETILTQLEANNVKGLGDVIIQHRSMQEKIESYCSQLQIQEKLRATLSSSLQGVDQYQANVDKHSEDYKALLLRSHESLEVVFNETRRILIKDLQGHTGTLTKTLNDIKSLRAQIKDTEKQLKKQKELVIGYSQLVEGLSPKTGVVAEQMVGFIETFVEQMNDVIAAIWTYEMEMLPGRTSDADLSYLFPVKLHGDSNRFVPDIKESSDGQRSIFDFAFKITAMLYLDHVNVPLLLDEVDRPLAPLHKERLMRFITQAVENGRFSQVFLISHHASSHGALPYPDIVDFDFRNPQPESNRVAFFQ